ncbi:NUDIX hydrolase [Nostocoides australiense]|nr:NUDIX domain-containing protein [Tetrasphaera sp.]HPF80052.1 NUDIX domain-containing protein [Tetrasphaera australiensis]HRW02798.1 NUDIX domain-containing protein [Tetrasphaera sp.]
MSRGIRIVGVTLAGDEVVDVVLPHGADPSDELHRRGWSMTGVRQAFTPSDEEGVTIQVSVVAEVGEERHTTWVPATSGERPPEGVDAVVVQRLAAYAVVVRDGLVLATRLAADVRGAAHRWTLPGGGVDPGEDPATGLRREVWEETGQYLGEIRLLDLLTSHWVGQAPDGTWEDYQVVRLVYAATVPEPGPLVVHDQGGTTSEAAWLDVDALAPHQRAPLLAADRWLTWRAAAGDQGLRGPRQP